MRRTIISFPVMVFTMIVHAQDLTRSGTILISVNPLKLLYAIPNFEIEFQVSRSVSFQIYGEYLLGKYVFDRNQYPEATGRVGVRYHLNHAFNIVSFNDAYVGAFMSYYWSGWQPSFRSLNAGADAGFKHRFVHPHCISVKGLATIPLKDPKILPGFEAMYGWILRD